MANKQRPSRTTQAVANAAIHGYKMAANERRELPFGLGTGSGYSYGYHLSGHYPQADFKRQVWDQAGYPDTILPEMLFNMYRRNGLARAVANLKVDKSWQTDPVVYEGDTDPERRKNNPTEFEKEFDELAKRIKLFKRLKTADRFQRIMRYSGLVIVCKEMNRLKPEDDLTSVAGPDAILDLKPVYETQIVIEQANQDITSPDYGQPLYFQFRSETPGTRNPWETHNYELSTSRVITLAEDASDDTPYGVSALEAPYNALMDAEKTRMAGAEGYYKNAKQRAVISYRMEDNQGLTAEDADAMTEAVNEEARDFNAMLGVGGADVHSLQSQLADPTQPWTIAVNECCASEGYPMTILIGQMTGRLASDEDQSHFGQLIMSRRNEFCTDAVLKVIGRFQEINALPKADDLYVEWEDLTATTQEDKYKNVKLMAEANKIQKDAMQGPVFTEDEMRLEGGFTPDEQEEVKDVPEGDDELRLVE